MSSQINASSRDTASNKETVRTPQNENNLATSVVLFVICFALFLGAIYSLSFLTLGNPWPMAVCLGLLRPFKGLMLAAQFANKASEARHDR